MILLFVGTEWRVLLLSRALRVSHFIGFASVGLEREIIFGLSSHLWLKQLCLGRQSKWYKA